MHAVIIELSCKCSQCWSIVSVFLCRVIFAISIIPAGEQRLFPFHMLRKCQSAWRLCRLWYTSFIRKERRELTYINWFSLKKNRNYSIRLHLFLQTSGIFSLQSDPKISGLSYSVSFNKPPFRVRYCTFPTLHAGSKYITIQGQIRFRILHKTCYYVLPDTPTM
jgi:hypothetical protein